MTDAANRTKCVCAETSTRNCPEHQHPDNFAHRHGELVHSHDDGGENHQHPDLVENLRSLARSEHMDLSLGDEAADEIERLRKVEELARRVLVIHANDCPYGPGPVNCTCGLVALTEALS